MQSSVFAQGLEIDAQSYFSAELSKLVVGSTGCDQFEASSDGSGDPIVRGFSSSFEKVFRDLYGDFSRLRHGRIIVTWTPGSMPAIDMVSSDDDPERGRSLSSGQERPFAPSDGSHLAPLVAA